MDKVVDSKHGALAREKDIALLFNDISVRPDLLGEIIYRIDGYVIKHKVQARQAALEVICRDVCIDCEHDLSVFKENGSYCHTFLENTRPCCADRFRKLLAEVE